MEIADKDNNGELDYKEFHEFIAKMDGIMMSEDEIRCMFNEFDGSGNQ
jgi:Ca2+-binding EF-hand superfamily protein